MLKTRIVIFIAIISIFFKVSAQTSTEVIEKYLEVTNTKSALPSLKNFTYQKTYKANASTDFTEEVSVISSENKLSRKKSILERDFFYILNDNAGWIKIPMGSRDKAPNYTVKDLNAKERSDLADEIKDGLLPFVNFEEKGYQQVGEVSSVKIDEVDCYKITISRGDTKIDYFFDSTTGLLKREILTEGSIIHTSDITKFATAKNGVIYPSEAIYSNTKDKRRTIVTTVWLLDAVPQANMFLK